MLRFTICWQLSIAAFRGPFEPHNPSLNWQKKIQINSKAINTLINDKLFQRCGFVFRKKCVQKFLHRIQHIQAQQKNICYLYLLDFVCGSHTKAQKNGEKRAEKKYSHALINEISFWSRLRRLRIRNVCQGQKCANFFISPTSVSLSVCVSLSLSLCLSLRNV